jgi:hypothetical protein
LFLYILYLGLVDSRARARTRYPCLILRFFSDSFQTLLNRAYNSLEWCLNGPAKPHAFLSLPLKIKLKKRLIRILIFTNLYKFAIVFFAGVSPRCFIKEVFKLYVYSDYLNAMCFTFYFFSGLFLCFYLCFFSKMLNNATLFAPPLNHINMGNSSFSGQSGENSI